MAGRKQRTLLASVPQCHLRRRHQLQPGLPGSNFRRLRSQAVFINTPAPDANLPRGHAAKLNKTKEYSNEPRRNSGYSRPFAKMNCQPMDSEKQRSVDEVVRELGAALNRGARVSRPAVANGVPLEARKSWSAAETHHC